MPPEVRAPAPRHRILRFDFPNGPHIFWWHVSSILVLLVVPSYVALGRAPWAGGFTLLPQLLLPALAYSVAALCASTGVIRRMAAVVLTGFVIASVLASAFLLALELLEQPVSLRLAIVSPAMVAATLLFAPIVNRFSRLPAIANLLLVSVLCAQEAYGAATHDSSSVIASLRTSTAVIEYRTSKNLIPDVKEGEGGAIAAYEDGYLLVDGGGTVYHVEIGDGFIVTPIEGTVPANRQAYRNDFAQAEAISPFRTLGIAIDTFSTPHALYVSHHLWHSPEQCIAVQLSRSLLTRSDARLQLGPWEKVYETTPCVSSPDRLRTLQSGGKIVVRVDDILLTVGDFDKHSAVGVADYAQDTTTDYGKVLSISRQGSSRVYTRGHRNPQGLASDRDGRIWLTEHGPQGGDELNLIRPGRNYGWPLTTYGTEYGQLKWARSPDAGSQIEYTPPVYAFVPSIAPTSLIAVSPGSVPGWDGDLLIASLRGRSLYRVRLDGDRVVFAESMMIHHRIRDLAQGADGRMVLWGDSGELTLLWAAARQQ